MTFKNLWIFKRTFINLSIEEEPIVIFVCVFNFYLL